MGNPLQFVLTQLTYTPKQLPPSLDLTSQIALITGSNTGIGLQAAHLLATHKVAHIILGVRDVSKGIAAKERLSQAHPDCQFQVWQLDLKSTPSITSFAKKAQGLERLDIVILNAGVKYLTYTTTATGYETNLQVNHLGTSLLSLLLLPKLRQTARKSGKPTRLTFTSSEVHFWTPFHERQYSAILTRMNDPDSFKQNSMERYNTTKLLNVLWFRELAGYVDGKKVVINGVNPGFVVTELHRHDGSMGFRVLKGLLGWKDEMGARLVAGAAVVLGEESHGGYVQEGKVVRPSKFVRSDEGGRVQKRVWNETVEVLRRSCPVVDFDGILSGSAQHP